MKKKEIKSEFENEVLDISRVERMTAGGRRLRFRTIVVVGNKKGKVGVGSAKGADVQQSIEKSNKKAQKTAVKIALSEGGTIPHEVKAKYGAAVVLLKPQSEGRGLVAGGTVRMVCSMAGIENISGKLLGNTRNKLNNARATIKALEQIKEDKKAKKEVVKEDPSTSSGQEKKTEKKDVEKKTEKKDSKKEEKTGKTQEKEKEIKPKKKTTKPKAETKTKAKPKSKAKKED